MASNSSIEWTEATWNPVTGCTKISTGCKHCYAERMARRLQAMGNIRYHDGFRMTLHEDLLAVPRRWRSPRTIFVNSMSDLFHKNVPVGFIQRVFRVMNECPQHTFQILTKRGGRLKSLANLLNWTPNIWIGVSVENDQMYHRIYDLHTVPAAVRFLSCEPLLGPIEHLPLAGIQWVIVGGESGPGARPMAVEWVRSIKAQCQRTNTAFFFKQWGGVQKHRTGRKLDGQTWDEIPESTSWRTWQTELPSIRKLR